MVSQGDPPLDISWSFHGQAGDMSKLGISTNKVGKKASMLLIESANSLHRGNYTCTVRNPVGIVNFSTSLEIHGNLFWYKGVFDWSGFDCI